MSISEKKSFIMYDSFRNMFERLSLEDRGALITAIFEYTATRSTGVELSDVAAMAFCCIKDTLDRDRATYEEKCRINSENGKKGGRPRSNNAGAVGATESQKPFTGSANMNENEHQRGQEATDSRFFTPKTERFFEKAKKADNDNGNDNEKDNDNDTVNGNGNENDNESASAETSPLPVSDEAGSASLSEEIQESILKSIPKEYIDARLERASLYAKKNGMNVNDVLYEWWKVDQKSEKLKSRPRYEKQERDSYAMSSFDTNDFFAAALSRFMKGG